MNVNVPTSIGSKFLPRIRRIIGFSSILVISMLLWQITREVQEMRFKVHILNKNYQSLQWKHKSLNERFSKVATLLDTARTSCACLEPAGEKEKVEFFSEKPSNVGHRQVVGGPSWKNDSGEMEKASRDRRSLILPSPKRNATTVARLEMNVQGGELDNFRSARMRRDEGRGKKRTKMKRRPKRSRGRLAPLMATFLGAVPEQHVIDSAHIGPWVKSIKNESKYSFNKFHLVEDRKAIEVSVDGLYMISAQIYYFGDFTHHSYWILLNAEGASVSQKLVKCAAASALPDREVSCFTSIVLTLNRGDRIYFQQQERGRLINLREGYSYVQFVLLSTDVKRRF